MRRFAVLVLLLLGSSAAAQRGAVHTPPRGSAERRQILDAMRAEHRRHDPRPLVYVVNRLRVHGAWAWLEVAPQSSDGREHFEPESALIRRASGRWSVAEVMPSYDEREGTPLESDCAYFRDLRRRFAAIPADVLPAVTGCRP